MRACTSFREGSIERASGSPKASVLPVPVCGQPHDVPSRVEQRHRAFLDGRGLIEAELRNRAKACSAHAGGVELCGLGESVVVFVCGGRRLFTPGLGSVLMDGRRPALGTPSAPSP